MTNSRSWFRWGLISVALAAAGIMGAALVLEYHDNSENLPEPRLIAAGAVTIVVFGGVMEFYRNAWRNRRFQVAMLVLFVAHCVAMTLAVRAIPTQAWSLAALVLVEWMLVSAVIETVVLRRDRRTVRRRPSS